jgi:drug/metabolite transporter (DMT)-like permease
MFFLGLIAAVAAAVMFNIGIALQALEARKAPKSLSLTLGIIWHLLRRPLWLLGSVLGILGIVPQLVALAWAPFAVVQTTLTAGLVVLLFVAVRYLGEKLDRMAITGVVLLVVGVALVSWGAPSGSERHRGLLAPVFVVAGTAVIAFAPFVARRWGESRGFLLALSAGIGFAGANIATKLASDNVGLSHWPQAVAWGTTLIVLGVCATITSMSAIQRAAATMVVPVSTAVQTFVPIVLEPLFLHERYTSLWTQALPVAAGTLVSVAGVTLVGRDPAVADLAVGRR